MKKIFIPFVVWMLFVAGYLALRVMGGKISTPVVQIINWIILAAIIAVCVYFVGLDTRKRTLSWPETVAWVAVSVATFFYEGEYPEKLRVRGEK